MKFAMVAVALVTISFPAVAHNHAAVPTTAVSAGAAAPARSKLTVDMPIADLVFDAKARAALDINFLGISTHAMYKQFKGMSLKQLQPMAADKISDAAIEKLAVDLAAIK